MTMDRDIINLMKDSISTFLNIAQMTQYRMRYAQNGKREDKEKMHKHAFLAGTWILCLLTMGIVGLIESRKDSTSFCTFSRDI